MSIRVHRVRRGMFSEHRGLTLLLLGLCERKNYFFTAETLRAQRFFFVIPKHCLCDLCVSAVNFSVFARVLNIMKSLIADDDLIARLLLSEILGKYGQCDAAVDGVEAVRAFRLSLQRDKPYDLVCLDIMMPNMDGMEALKNIREVEESLNITPEQGTKIIMVTALLDQLTKDQAFDDMCDCYLAKPVESNILMENLKQLNLI